MKRVRRNLLFLVVSAGTFSLACGERKQTPPRHADSVPAPSSVAATSAASSARRPPATAKRAVEDTYHGVTVVDEYRWLEQSSDPEVQAWSAAQSAHARATLDALPETARVRARVSDVFHRMGARYGALIPNNGRWFVTKLEPPRQQEFLVLVDPATNASRVLVDPNAIDPSGKTALDWFVPSPDGKLVAVSMSHGGTEMGDLSVIDVATGKALPDAIPRVNGGTAGGDLVWLKDGSGFLYTRYPRPGERPDEDLNFYQQLYFHELGTAESADRRELGDGLPKIAEIQLDVDHATDRVLATVQRGDGGEFSHYLRERTGTWRKLTDFTDPVQEIAFGPKGELYLLTRKTSPRGTILRLPFGQLDVKKAVPFVGETENTLVTSFWGEGTFLATPTNVYATYQLGGPSIVRAFDLTAKPTSWAAPLEIASNSGLRRDGRAVTFRSESFLAPAAWYSFDEKARTTKKTPLADSSPFDLRGYEVVREFAVSKDGTQVPLNIVLPAGVPLDGTNPCVVTGYGGYGNSLDPVFKLDTGLWVERGVIYVIANLRGGGEFGEEWHRQGSLELKQNVFDDFAAVLRHLAARKYTRPERLGIIGGSNGGLLMGAMLSQHPDLFAAAVSFVGIYDMLRSELSPNGAFNVTEFGTVKDPKQFAALYAYSPYHHVRDGIAYPPTLLVTGENDPRVDPMQSRKMAARLQAANAGTAPILFVTSAGVGHGGDTALDKRIAEKTDVFSFMFHHLAVPIPAP